MDEVKNAKTGSRWAGIAIALGVVSIVFWGVYGHLASATMVAYARGVRSAWATYIGLDANAWHVMSTGAIALALGALAISFVKRESWGTQSFAVVALFAAAVAQGIVI